MFLHWDYTRLYWKLSGKNSHGNETGKAETMSARYTVQFFVEMIVHICTEKAAS